MRKMVRWSVGAGSVPGGALGGVGGVGGARFGVLRAGEDRVAGRGRMDRGKIPVAGQRGVKVGRRLVGRRRAGHRRAGRTRSHQREAI